MKIKEVKFVTTVADKKNLLNDNIIEFAFVGRSNAGKSSLINAYLVDLPGYGYHKASKADEKKWVQLIDDYLLNSQNLSCVFVLMDVRHTPSVLDKQMITFLHYYQIPYIVIATKADKVSKTRRHSYASKLAQSVGLTINNIIVTSSEEKLGMDTILQKMASYLGQAE
jgi:GTP-binding protein